MNGNLNAVGSPWQQYDGEWHDMVKDESMMGDWSTMEEFAMPSWTEDLAARYGKFRLNVSVEASILGESVGAFMTAGSVPVEEHARSTATVRGTAFLDYVPVNFETSLFSLDLNSSVLAVRPTSDYDAISFKKFFQELFNFLVNIGVHVEDVNNNLTSSTDLEGELLELEFTEGDEFAVDVEQLLQESFSHGVPRAERSQALQALARLVRDAHDTRQAVAEGVLARQDQLLRFFHSEQTSRADAFVCAACLANVGPSRPELLQLAATVLRTYVNGLARTQLEMFCASFKDDGRDTCSSSKMRVSATSTRYTEDIRASLRGDRSEDGDEDVLHIGFNDFDQAGTM